MPMFFINTSLEYLYNLCCGKSFQGHRIVCFGLCPGNYGVVLYVIGGFSVIYLIDMDCMVFLHSRAMQRDVNYM